MERPKGICHLSTACQPEKLVSQLDVVVVGYSVWDENDHDHDDDDGIEKKDTCLSDGRPPIQNFEWQMG